MPQDGDALLGGNGGFDEGDCGSRAIDCFSVARDP